MAEFVQKIGLNPLTLTIRGRLVELCRPLVMGILNLTPDSFYAGSRETDAQAAALRARKMIEEGADIIDIGACSTRPGSAPVSEEEEMMRLEGPLTEIRRALPKAVISVDTFRSSIARECMARLGVEIINDITGGADPAMYATVASAGACYILMHNRGASASAHPSENYGPDVVADVVSELAFKVNEARKAGICNLIVDPGFGFAKDTGQNYAILSRLECLKELGCPILVGLSRKRMAREACGCDVADSLVPTVALNTVALMKGAFIIRVHDVKEGVMTVKTIEALI